MPESIKDLRRDYLRDSLSISDLPGSPLELFASWFDDARQEGVIVEPNAMILLTVSASGEPSARVVLLKSFGADGFVFYTNQTSRKGEEIAANPAVALTFWWDRLERQVRVEGRATKVAPDESDAYFQVRPRGSQLGAWSSPQSQVIDSREALYDAYVRCEETYEGKPVPRPPHWGGFRVTPRRAEFWQGRSNRLHDRFVYELLEEGGWRLARLAP